MGKNNLKPPKAAFWVIKKFSKRYHRSNALGDLEEMYQYYFNKSGAGFAKRWYWRQALKSIPFLFNNHVYWRKVMFKNYFKITIRNIKKQRTVSAINIMGLAFAFSYGILVMLTAQDFYNVDKFHKNADRIYLVYSENTNSVYSRSSYITPSPLGKELKENFPEILNSARLMRYNRAVIHYANKMEYETQICFADPSVFEIFSFQIISGDEKKVLSNPQSVLVSEKIARKYFGDEDPLGKIINIDNRIDVTVNGVFRDAPINSTIRFEILLPFNSPLNRLQDRWDIHICYTYVLLREGTSIEDLNASIGTWKKQFPVENHNYYVTLFKDLYLFGLGDYPGLSADLKTFIFIAVVLLLTGCFNFINLSTARLGPRSLEIGIRKVVGANGKDIIRQYLGESVILALFAVVIAVILVIFILPYYNMMDYQRPLNFNVIKNFSMVGACIVLAVLAGLFSGSYPAFVLSKFRPVRILQGGAKSGSKKQRLRKFLVIVQFAFSIVFIGITLASRKQTDYERNLYRGFDMNNVILLSVKGDMRDRIEFFKNDLLSRPEIVSVAASSSFPSGGVSAEYDNFDWEGKDPERNVFMYHMAVDYEYMDLYKMELKQGRNFSRDYATDINNYILNETAVQALGWDSPVGKQFSLYGRKGVVIGVVKNFHFHRLFEQIHPMVIRMVRPENLYWISIKFDNNNSGIEQIKSYLENTWEKYAPNYPFEYSILEERIRQESDNDDIILMSSITFFIILISTLGLYGLVSYMTLQQSKEIAVRKIFGAYVSDVIFTISKEYLKYILISILIAVPVTWIFVKMMFDSMPYNAGMSLDFFLYSIIFVVIISIITISFHVIRAARANPVDSLRYE